MKGSVRNPTFLAISICILLLSFVNPSAAQVSLLRLLTKTVAKSADNTASAARTGSRAISAEEISKASGLGKAVPDNIAALMIHTPGKTLADVEDMGVKAWLTKPTASYVASDAQGLMRDYELLLQGKPALGPLGSTTLTFKQTLKTSEKTQAAAQHTLPWYAPELLIRAAHLGDKLAQKKLEEQCNNPAQFKIPGAVCKNTIKHLRQ